MKTISYADYHNCNLFYALYYYLQTRDENEKEHQWFKELASESRDVRRCFLSGRAMLSLCHITGSQLQLLILPQVRLSPSRWHG